MANFVEQPRQFSPYVQQIPIDAFVASGMQRQAQYEQGVQKVNNYIESLNGINVARQLDHQYLQGRIADVTQRVNDVASADWSNQGIVSQVGKLAGIVANDQTIRNAVISTKKYQKDEADIVEAKKNGKWAPENEWMLRKEMSEWFAAPTPGAVYNSAGYKPYVDVASEIIKSWKDAHPDSTLVQKPNRDFYAYTVVNNERVGTDGRTLIETSVKELRPDEIAGQINALLTGQQREQLAITGLYQNRNINDSQGLNKLVDDHYRKTENYYQKLVDNENLNLTLHSGDSQKVNEIKKRISDIEKRRSEVLATKKTLKEGAATNPDGLKSSLFFEDWINGVSEMLGYSETSEKIVDNPSYKAFLEEFKIWADLQMAQMSASAKLSSSSGRKSKKSSEDDEGNDSDWEPVTATVLPISEKDRAEINLASFSSRLAAMGNQMDQSMLQLLYRQFGESYVNRTVKDLNGDGIAEDVYTLKKEKENDAKLVQASWWDAYRKGNNDLDIIVKQTLQDTDEQRLVSTKLAKVISTLEDKGNKYAQNLPEYKAFKKAESLYNTQPSVNLYGVDVSAADIKSYQSLVQKTVKSSPSAGAGAPGLPYVPVPDDATLAKYGLSRAKFEVLNKASDSYGHVENQHYRQMLHRYDDLRDAEFKVNKHKDSYINDEIRKYAGIFNEVALTLPSSKPAEVRPIANFVSTLAANARETGMGGATNWKLVREMINGDNNAHTAYSYVQDKDGHVRIRLSNPDVDKGSPQEILVDSQTARLNNLSVPDYLSSTRSMLELGENIRTGSTFEESIPTNNQLTGKYSVRHEVENFGGKYKVKLYISDPTSGETTAQEVPINSVMFPDWTKLTYFLQHDLNEKFINSLLGKPTATAAPGAFPQLPNSLFSTNPLIPQYGQ